jgi:hypothetical protein
MNMHLANLCRDLGNFHTRTSPSLSTIGVWKIDGVLDADDESCIGELTAFVDMGAVGPQGGSSRARVGHQPSGVRCVSGAGQP